MAKTQAVRTTVATTEIKPSAPFRAVVRWANLDTTDDYDKYTITLCQLSEGAVAELAALGIVARTDGSESAIRGSWIKVAQTTPFKVIKDAEGEPFSGKLHNDSVVTAVVFPSEHKRGVSAKLRKLVVVELGEPYVGDTPEEDNVEPL